MENCPLRCVSLESAYAFYSLLFHSVFCRQVKIVHNSIFGVMKFRENWNCSSWLRPLGSGGGGDDDDEIKGTCVLHRAYVCITLLIGLEQRAVAGLPRCGSRREVQPNPRFPILTFRAPDPAPHISGSS